MAAPERFADKSDSSCTAGAVHTWPIATFGGHATIWSLSERSGYRSASELDGSVANDPGLAEDVYNIFASVAVSRRLDNCQMLLVGRVREGLCQGSSNIFVII